MKKRKEKKKEKLQKQDAQLNSDFLSSMNKFFLHNNVQDIGWNKKTCTFLLCHNYHMIHSHLKKIATCLKFKYD